MYILFLVFLFWVLAFLISVALSLAVKTTFFKRTIVFLISLIFLKSFTFGWFFSVFGMDLKPKKDMYPIIYSSSGAKLHINNVCNSIKTSGMRFWIPNIDLNALIDSNGKRVICTARREYHNNDVSFQADTRGSDSWLEGDMLFFNYEYIGQQGKYKIYKHHGGGGKVKYYEEDIVTYIASDGYRVRIEKDSKTASEYVVARRLDKNFELHYELDRKVTSFEELERIDDVISAYVRSISRREK